MGVGSACTSSFSRIAQRSLTLRPAHSHGHLCDRHPGASDTSSPPCLPRLLPAGAARRVGLAPTRKRRLCTAHPNDGRSRTFSATRLRPLVHVPKRRSERRGLGTYPPLTMLARMTASGRSRHRRSLAPWLCGAILPLHEPLRGMARQSRVREKPNIRRCGYLRCMMAAVPAQAWIQLPALKLYHAASRSIRRRVRSNRPPA
jgi:hypothetical protein